MKDIPVLQAKRFGVYSCRMSDTLKQATKIMTVRNISCLVVVGDYAELKGIITRIDLVRAAYWEANWAEGLVRDYMNPDVVTVKLDDTLQRVMELLIDRHIHRVVAVRDENGRQIPMGILSAADIVYHMAQEG
ncbi:MAG: CBS domain-containing protein [Caldilineaceae bacterium]|nr:CBS domain-containing protein [Caldilineaceae bacterium]MCB9139847.1 CBS domain-containing protein [Caldilineaceae bacterium]